MKKTYRFLSLLLCAVMLFGMLPLGAFAAEETLPQETLSTEETTAPQDETVTEETTAPTEDTGISPLANNDDGTTTIPGSTTTLTENVYVLTSAPTNNGTYLIVNTNTAGSGYALLNNNGSVSAVAVTVNSCDQGAYIVLNNAGAVWTATGSDTSWAFANNGSYLGHSQTSNNSGLYTYYSHTPALSANAVNWVSNGTSMYADELLYRKGNISGNETTDDYYLAGGSSWTMSTSSSNVYFFTPGTATVTVPDVTYGITVSTSDGTTENYTAEYITNESTLALSKTIWSNPTGYESNVTGGTYAWTSSNEDVATVADGTVSFTGKAGSTTVRVTYTQGEYVIWDEIVITAEPAGYHAYIVDAEGNSLDGTITVKGETAIAAGLDLDSLVAYETSATESEEVTDAVVVWSVSDTSIATIGTDGKLTFTGKEGVITVTLTYTDADGNVYTDTVNVSVSKSEYFTPSDGTNDFPDYPNEGAVRIDKNAQAVGNFSETGVAKVELSMTGVPYTAGSEVDVVIMVDMSGSMNSSSNDMKVDRVTPAKQATRAAVAALVMNEDGTINSNRVAVYTFQGSSTVTERHPLETFTQSTLTSLIGTDTDSDGVYEGGSIANWSASDGTPYDKALEKCQTVLEAAKTDGTGDNREQFVIFVTDGAPSTAFYYVKSDGTKGTVASDVGSGDEDDVAYYELDTYTEWYSYQMKKAGVEVYSLGIQISESSCPVSIGILRGIAGTVDENGNVVNAKKDSDGNETVYGKYFQSVGTNIEDLTDVFLDIVSEIKQAATNVTVTDKITDEYTLILEAPENVTLPDGTALTIDVLEYTLDADKNRSGDPKVIESVSLTDTEKVTFNDDGTIASIDGEYFDYDGATHTITWKADKLDTKELALSYYLYLEQSAGVDAEEQTAPGTYPTNEYAYITYTNHLDHPCQKEYPVPQLTWNGAQVSYTFYLVNEQGQPVNRAGRVIPFAEAIYVTDVYTESVTWDTDEDKTLSAEMIAEDLLPDVYELYDTNTAYTINVYEDEEGKDLGNHFIIAADKTTTTNSVTTSTTKVFNTKAGTIYSAPGTYDKDNVFTGFDFANTTVAFAVIWKSQLAPDTVVIDFGLDVVIDVTTNDALEAQVVGVRADQPNAVINSGNITPAKAQSAEVKLNNVLMGNASVENMSSVRFSLDKDNGMQFTAPVEFYYESEASYYNSNNVLTTAYLYSSVTVIPATTIYYEDDYVELTSYTVAADGTSTKDATSKWVNDTEYTATQQQDRPGASQISAVIDADNNYGYDAAYKNMATHSMGSGAKITVDSATRGEATFTFYGTGFDVIGMTSNTTGTIIVQLYKGASAEGEPVESIMVDTYYGYTRANFQVTYVYDAETRLWSEKEAVQVDELGAAQDAPADPADGAEYTTYEVRWVVSANDPNALYQVPVMKTTGLTYGQYTVKIVAGYNDFFDHNKADSNYDLYLDAIRIYDPTGNLNDDANAAYEADGEGWPQYMELRNKVIAAANYTVTKNEDGSYTVSGNPLSGAIFIDSDDATTSIADYVSYGPNNELYLAPGQSVAFALDQTYASIIADVQIGMKLGNGTAASYEIYNAAAINGTKSNEMTGILNTATDMYYSIKEQASGNIVITNTSASGGGILSITNIKVTYTQDPLATEEVMTTDLYVDEEVATAAVMSLRRMPVVEEPEVTEPETEATEPENEATEPETEVTEPETEATEPETTEPETEESVPETTEPETDNSGSGSIIIKIIKKLLGWLFG